MFGFFMLSWAYYLPCVVNSNHFWIALEEECRKGVSPKSKRRTVCAFIYLRFAKLKLRFAFCNLRFPDGTDFSRKYAHMEEKSGWLRSRAQLVYCYCAVAHRCAGGTVQVGNLGKMQDAPEEHHPATPLRQAFAGFHPDLPVLRVLIDAYLPGRRIGPLLSFAQYYQR